MGRYVRILSPSIDPVSLSALRRRLRSEDLGASIEVVRGVPSRWTELEVVQPGEVRNAITVIEKNRVKSGSLGAAEIKEFLNELDHLRPVSGANWVKQYLRSVRTIYCFQILRGVEQGRGWDVLQALQDEIWETLGGIFQADGQGFSNDDGLSVVWQFSDNASGLWNMAILDEDGWAEFEMDLGNRAQREAFKAGQVPDGAKEL